MKQHCLKASTLLFTALPVLCWGNSVYIGYGETELTTSVGEQTLNLTPSGVSLMADFDVTEEISVSIDTSRYSDSVTQNNLIQVEYEVETLGAGISYNLENWSTSYQYSQYNDEEFSVVLIQNQPNSQIEAKANTHSIGLSRYFSNDDWQFSLYTGVHYSDWEQDTVIDAPSPNRPLETSVDEGDSLFVSLGGGISHYWSLSDNRSVLIGTFISWNELTDSGSAAISRNGTNVSQIRDVDIRDQINAFAAIGSESYGQVNLYLSVDVTDNLVWDVDASFDFSTDDNSAAWSTSVGYFFQ